MKFLCIECDQQMTFEEREVPGDGTFAAAFSCPKCGRRIAMLANPMETQLVGALGVKIGGRTLDQQPLELVRSGVVGRDDAFQEGGPADGRAGGQAGPKGLPRDPERDDSLETPLGRRRTGGPPHWSIEAQERLARVPGFVRGMVKRIYADYAVEQGIQEITPEVMDRARSELGLEGM